MIGGLDPDQHVAYVPPRFINEAAIARRIQARYPRDAVNAGEQAIFRMRVIVEADGTVSDCSIENSTEGNRLESPACREMMKAQFEPARAHDGGTMRSFFATTVSYVVR